MKPFASRFVVLLTLGLVAATANAQTDSSSIIAKGIRSIAITATDKVTHQADVATVHIGFELYGPEQPALYTEAAKTSNAIMDALRSAGVAKENIESEQQSVGPAEPWQIGQFTPAERASHAFIAQQSWTVRSTPADAARIIDLAARGGANKSGQIDWSLRDQNAASAEAAGKALQHARAQAAAMAAGLNVKLGQLLYASNEVQAEPVRPMVMMALAGKAAPAPRPLAINPRQIETSATVYAVFAIE